MNKKIIIQKNVLTTELALLVDDEFVQYYIESALESNLQNKIVIGQVMQVVKNLNAAFVDYGDEKNGMLHFKQIPEMYKKKLNMGSRLPVQIVKQNIGEKGHKLTSKLNLMGKYLVCLPFEEGINISKKITKTTYRESLKKHLEDAVGKEYGFIVRTHAMEATLDEIIEDAKELVCKANQILEGKDCLAKGSVLYEEPSIILQILMEHLEKKVPIEIICNDKEYIDTIQALIDKYPHAETTKITLYEEQYSIFASYSLQKKIDELLKRKIWLKNGGNLIVDYTEAMTIIDVNSAKAILTKNAEKATLELNKQATKEAILQILRRNLSGIIIVDLVEMKHSHHKDEIFEYAKILLEQYGDRRTKVYPLTDLGLLQFSRTKKYQCIPHQLLEQCNGCHMPYVKSSFLFEIMTVEHKLKALQLKDDRQALFLEAHPDFYEILSSSEAILLLEAHYPVKIQIVKGSVNENKKILCQFYQR